MSDKKTKRIYISGPITGKPDLNRPAFSKAAERLIRLGFVPANPHENGVPADAPHKTHMREDFRMLLDCDGILQLDGWEQSNGCGYEFLFGRALGLKRAEEKYEDQLLLSLFEKKGKQ